MTKQRHGAAGHVPQPALSQRAARCLEELPDIVVVPLKDYLELLEIKRAYSETAINHDQFTKPSRSPIERNPEVAVFLMQRFGLMPVKEILRQCRRRFGKALTPSTSAAYGYWQRVRKQSSSSR